MLREGQSHDGRSGIGPGNPDWRWSNAPFFPAEVLPQFLSEVPPGYARGQQMEGRLAGKKRWYDDGSGVGYRGTTKRTLW